MSTQKQSSITLIAFALALVFVLLIVYVFFTQSNATLLNYSEFQSLLDAGAIQEVTLGEQQLTAAVNKNRLDSASLSAKKMEQIRHPGKSQYRIMTTLIHDPGLIQKLSDKNVIISGEKNNEWLILLRSFLIPFLVFFAAWLFIMRRNHSSREVLSLEENKSTIYVETETQVTFKDVAGIEEAKVELMEIVKFLKNPAYYRRLGAHIPKGILLLGAPGTGKTLLARAIAGEADVPFFSISGSAFVEIFVGVGAARVRDLFDQARKHASAIIFIDEIDAIGRARSPYSLGGNDEKEQTLNQLLFEIDGFNPETNIVILAATNRPEVLDPALVRAGRFDRQIILNLPDIKSRMQILAVHLKKIHTIHDLNLEKIAALTPGFSGADLANLVNEAALHATRRQGTAVTNDDFTESFERIVSGIQNKNRIIKDSERHFIAYHEMGHAVVSGILLGETSIQKISLIPRGINALGYTLQSPTEDSYIKTEEQLETELTVLLAGRAAEFLILNHTSTGGTDDLAKATDIAHNMIMQYGMDEKLGHVTYEKIHSSFLKISPELIPKNREFSEKTAEQIDQSVRDLIKNSFDHALHILQENKGLLLKGAEWLIKKETLDESDIIELFKMNKKY